MKKRIISMLMVIFMLISILPTAFAADGDNEDEAPILLIGGKEIKPGIYYGLDENGISISKKPETDSYFFLSKEGSDYKLTLSNFEYTVGEPNEQVLFNAPIIFVKDTKLTIELIGDNVLTNTAKGNQFHSAGIFGGEIHITGSGSLEINARFGIVALNLFVNGSSTPTDLLKNLTIESGTVKINSIIAVLAEKIDLSSYIDPIILVAQIEDPTGNEIRYGPEIELSKTMLENIYKAFIEAFGKGPDTIFGALISKLTITPTKPTSPASSDAAASEITIGNTKLTPDSTEIEHTVSASTNKINIDVTAPEGATVTGDIGVKTLKVGKNVFKFTITAADGKTSITYTVTIYREAEKQEKKEEVQSAAKAVSAIASGVSNVSVNATVNGNISVNRKNAYKNAYTVITVTPETGKTIKDIVVTDEDGKEIKVEHLYGSKYRFRMPASDVTIDAIFE